MNDFYKTRQEPCYNKDFAFGDSHTWGWGVEENEAWPALLDLINLGIRGSSANQVVRLAKELIPIYKPSRAFVLWPDWGRFEIKIGSNYRQVLPTDKDRINFMETHTDEWCLKNFHNMTREMESLCNDHGTMLRQMTLYDLIPYIDHADRWPRNHTGTHHSSEWHQWVANIINNNEEFPLADE